MCVNTDSLQKSSVFSSCTCKGPSARSLGKSDALMALQKIDKEDWIHRYGSFSRTAKLVATYNDFVIKRWVDAHTNLPFGARWSALKQMWLLKEQPSRQRQPSPQPEGFLLPESAISQSLIEAYLAADYRVDADSPFTLKAGILSEPLAQLVHRHQCDCAAYLTACNPLGRDVGDIENAARQAELGRELKGRSLRFIDGVGLDSQSEDAHKWPGEASFLVLGLSLETSRALGCKYEQNALIWCGKDAVPRLVLLR